MCLVNDNVARRREGSIVNGSSLKKMRFDRRELHIQGMNHRTEKKPVRQSAADWRRGHGEKNKYLDFIQLCKLIQGT